MMTEQEIFNRVRDHLLKQGKRAEDTSSFRGDDGGYSCMYRSPDGLKCAAGCLIADEHYTPVLENRRINCEPGVKALELSGVPADYIEFVQQLQEIHDWREPEEWSEALRNFALARGLQP